MTVGWITVLKSVPWDIVIRNAPRVANEAKKLWNMVAKKENTPEIYNSDTTVPASTENQSNEDMTILISKLEADVSKLNSQMLASSELIKELADQNTQLIRRIETNRIHMIWLTVLSSLAVITAVISLFYAV